jgi:hypothetical protein
VVTEEFRNLYRVVTRSLGQPALQAVWIAHPMISVPHPEMRRRAEPTLAAILEIVTGVNGHGSAQAGAGVVTAEPARPAAAERLLVEDCPEAVIERFEAEGWGDGFPIVPPTAARVARMLAYSDLEPSCVLGVMPPRWSQVTVEKLAINAVMAGCKPEYFPVVVTAVRAILTPRFNLYGVQGTTNPATPVLILNGPIARELGVNDRGNLFGPGFRANATIGRAIRLILTTVGGGVPQQTDRSTLGNPGKFSCCFAENEAASPWAPFQVDLGFAAETSTITAFGGAAPANIIEKSKTAAEMLNTIAQAVAAAGSNNMFMSQQALVVLGPEHAAIAAREGYSKEQVRQALFEQARISFEKISSGNADVLAVWRAPNIEETAGQRVLRIAERPEDILVLVAGGAGNHSASIPGWYSRSVTLPIARADGRPVGSVEELKRG